MNSITFEQLAEANKIRQAEWRDNGITPPLTYLATEFAGEAGEVCNEIKKLERERYGWRGSRTTVDKLADELADVIICASLIAIEDGIEINLSEAIVRKFNQTSDNIGLKTKLSLSNLVEAHPTVVDFINDRKESEDRHDGQ